MNVAVLFDTAEDGKAGTETLLAGKELYSYSFKTFYLHPGIDCIVMMRRDSENITYANEYIEYLKKEYGINKPIKMYQGIRDFGQVLDRFRRDGMSHVELYVLHDIRYPFVTANMIYEAAEKAALYGIAATAGEVKDDLASYPRQKQLETGDFRYVRYPVAIRAGHSIILLGI